VRVATTGRSDKDAARAGIMAGGSLGPRRPRRYRLVSALTLLLAPPLWWL
jgi:hypothetical protein